ncbi:MAG: archease [Pseudomonadota bacterium]|jgi:SHS2 domain-containing protein
MDTRGHWEHFEHVADIGVRGLGPTAAEAFAQAALALTALIVDPRAVESRERVTVDLEGVDLDYLFYDWINALVYTMATRHMLFGRFEVEIQDGRLHATAWGESLDRARHQPVVEVKGATLTELAVREENGQWLAQCVVDV